MFLQQKSVPATEADKQVIEDLLDTLKANCSCGDISGDHGEILWNHSVGAGREYGDLYGFDDDSGVRLTVHINKPAVHYIGVYICFAASEKEIR